LLESGGLFPSKISELTKLNRTTIYKVLENLAVKGLVTQLEKRKKFFYQVEPPKNLERYVSSKMTIARREVDHLHTLLPSLEGLFANTPNKAIIRFFEGQEGVLQVYRDHVVDNDKYEMLAFSNTADLMQFLSKDFRNEYIKNKVRIGITTRAILPDTEKDVDYNKTIYNNFPKNIWPKLKHIPNKVFPYRSDLTIYGKNKVSIINFSEPQFAGTIIEDQVIHDMMAMIFELSWAGTK
jgi:sugar-specific transcriptional regulator TrmB